MRVLPVAAAVFGFALSAAAPPPAAVPDAPNQETTALDPHTITHLGITPNSMGTITKTGTPAQGTAFERQPGSKQNPPNVREPLGPGPQASTPTPQAGAARSPHDISQQGHTMSGNFSGMGGAPDAMATEPLNPYTPILGGPPQSGVHAPGPRGR